MIEGKIQEAKVTFMHLKMSFKKGEQTLIETKGEIGK